MIISIAVKSTDCAYSGRFQAGIDASRAGRGPSARGPLFLSYGAAAAATKKADEPVPSGVVTVRWGAQLASNSWEMNNKPAFTTR
jgi:hypothetical protein